MDFFLDQYVSTKESWLADYCKEDKETESAKSEDWMGSSVDPPCFGQSKVSISTGLSVSVLIYRDSYRMVVLCENFIRSFD